jgi:hypothetical protein
MNIEISRNDFLRAAVGVPLPRLLLAQSNSNPNIAPPSEELGKYFSRKRYVPAPLPQWQSSRGQLPEPIYDSRPDWISMYWKAWELAFRNFHEPAPGSGYVSQFIDAAFNANIFLWDSCFMTMFCNCAGPLVPGIGTLDNFYAKQHEDGEICREIVRNTGLDFSEWVNHEKRPLFSRWGTMERNPPIPYDVRYEGRPAPKQNPKLTLDGLNHPVLAWAELESYRITGDKVRLGIVWEPLVRYYGALQEYLRQGNGLYMTDWASMDNSPRNVFLERGGTGVDISSEMVLFASQLAEIAHILDNTGESRRFALDAQKLTRIVNDKMWDPQRHFYYDLTLEGKRAPVKTIAAFWTLLARVASPIQARALARELENPKTFKRMHRVPTLAADEAGYDPAGGYWRGSVWAPTVTMVIRGLENFGFRALARDIAFEHLNMMAKVFEKTGTIWENYAPDSPSPGKPARPDFAGWSALGPILYLLEYAIGLRADAAHNRLTWNLSPGPRQGCERFRLNGHVTTLVATQGAGGKGGLQIEVDSDGDYLLSVSAADSKRDFPVKAGRQRFEI